MADPLEVLEDRHGRFTADAIDEAPAAARHDDVDEGVHGDQRADGGAIHRIHHLHAGRRQAREGQPLVDARGNRLVGVNGFGAASQDGGIAGLEAQPRGIGGHVGPRLVDDPDDSEGDAHAAHLDAGRPIGEITDLADGIGQHGNLPQPLGHGSDALGGELEAIQQGATEPLLACAGQIFRVGFGQLRGLDFDGLGDGQQRGVFLGSGGAPQHRGGGARLPAEALHVGVDVVCGPDDVCWSGQVVTRRVDYPDMARL